MVTMRKRPTTQRFGKRADSQDKCLLFRLPPELRLDIYHLCLLGSSPILNAGLPSETKHRRGGPRHVDKEIPALGTALLRTCRVIRSEVDIRPLYQENEFIFTKPRIAANFLTRYSNEYKPCVTAVTLDYREFFSTTEGCPNAIQTSDWSDYLCCSDGEAFLRRFNCSHGSHLVRNLMAGGLRTVILDFCHAQRLAAQWRVSRTSVPIINDAKVASAMRSWWEDCLSGIPATGHGVKVWIRLLDSEGRVKQVEVPGRWSPYKQRERKRVQALQEWFDETFDRSTAEGVFIAGIPGRSGEEQNLTCSD